MNEGYLVYVVDTETTGFDSVKNDVIEISMCRFTVENLDKMEQKTWKLKALMPENISDDALRVNKHKKEDILHFTKYGKETYLDPAKVVADIENWIIDDDVSAMDRVFAGQNPMFDIKALKELWNRVGTKDTFPFSLDKGYRILDTNQLVLICDLCTGKRRQYNNLGSYVKSFGVKKRKAHNAEDDTAMTTELITKIIEPIKLVIAESFKNCYVGVDDEA